MLFSKAAILGYKLVSDAKREEPALSNKEFLENLADVNDEESAFQVTPSRKIYSRL